MSSLTVTDRCPCGAALTLHGYALTVRGQHDGWLNEHKACREKPKQPPYEPMCQCGGPKNHCVGPR